MQQTYFNPLELLIALILKLSFIFQMKIKLIRNISLIHSDSFHLIKGQTDIVKIYLSFIIVTIYCIYRNTQTYIRRWDLSSGEVCRWRSCSRAWRGDEPPAVQQTTPKQAAPGPAGRDELTGKKTVSQQISVCLVKQSHWDSQGLILNISTEFVNTLNL